MANRNRNFKKTINKDVTQEDQRQAKFDKEEKTSAAGRKSKRGSGARSKGTKGGPEKGREGYYSYTDQDFSWYATNPSLINAAGSIAFSNWSGDLINWSTTNETEVTQRAFPGVMNFQIIPTYGLELQATDPLNVAAEKLWAYIFRTVSGQTFADAPDMMLYLLGMCEVFSYITWLERIYGEVNRWEPGNSYMPAAYAEAEGVNFSSIRKDRLKFYNYINLLIDQAGSLRVPKQFTLFQRRVFMFQNIYTEGLSPLSQQYMYTPAGFMQYGINNESKAGELQFRSLTGVSTADALYEFGASMINALLADQDVKKLSSLVLRAFGDEGVIKLNSFSMDYSTPIVYSLEVLEQMKNVETYPLTELNPTSLYLTQDPSEVQLRYNLTSREFPTTGSAATWNAAARASVLKKFIVTGVPNPDVPVIVENTRMKYVSTFVGGSTDSYSIIPASELCVGCNIIYNTSAGLATANVTSANVWAFTTLDASLVKTLLNGVAQLSSFKFHPATNFYYGVGNTLNRGNTMPIWDIDNWAELDVSVLQRLNRTVMYNLLQSETVASAWRG